MQNVVLYRFCRALLWMAIATGGATAEVIPMPIYPIGGSIAPYVDKDGYVKPIISLGSVDFGNGLKLPLTLNYSSAIRPPSQEFGQGWECPLFQAKIFDVQNNLKEMETLGGKDLYFVYNQRTDNWGHFFTEDWKGVADGDDFTLTYKNSYKFVFRKGLISSFTTPDERTIVWNRSGDKLVSLQELGHPPVLTITYDDLGFAKQLILNSDNNNVIKASFSFSSNIVYAGIEKIEGLRSGSISFIQNRDKDGNFLAQWMDPSHEPISLGWSSKTGKILSDNKYTYKIEEVSKDLTWPRITRTNKSTGDVESYYFDQMHGTTDEILADGTARHVEMIQAPGPNYKAIRLIQDTKNGATMIMLRRAFDINGNLLQESIGLAPGKEQIRQFTYDSAGHAISYFFNGKEMWRNSYNSITGQLEKRELFDLNVSLNFDSLPGGEVKEIIRQSKGAEGSVKILNASEWTETQASLCNVSN